MVDLHMKEAHEGTWFTVSRNSLTWAGPSLQGQQGPNVTKHQTQKINRWGDAVSIDVYLIVRESELWFAVHLLVTCLSCDSWALALAPILKTFSKCCFFSVGVFGATCQAAPFSLWEGTCGRIVLWLPVNREGKGTVVGFLQYM